LAHHTIKNKTIRKILSSIFMPGFLQADGRALWTKLNGPGHGEPLVLYPQLMIYHLCCLYLIKNKPALYPLKRAEYLNLSPF